MPKAMQDMGTAMHHSASRFAIAAGNGNVKPALMVLSEVTQSCVACHSSFRLQ
jgi:cytochrome c556